MVSMSPDTKDQLVRAPRRPQAWVYVRPGNFFELIASLGIIITAHEIFLEQPTKTVLRSGAHGGRH